MRISAWSSDVCSSDLDRQMRLQLAPEGEAVQQGAAPVQPRQGEAEGRVHVEVAVDEGRRHQVPAGVDLLPRRRLDLRSHFGDAAILHGDVLPAFAGGQGGVADDEVEHGSISRLYGTAPAAPADRPRGAT